jgi:hypothetical protein
MRNPHCGADMSQSRLHPTLYNLKVRLSARRLPRPLPGAHKKLATLHRSSLKRFGETEIVIFIFYGNNRKLLNTYKLKHIFKIKSLIVTSDDRKCWPSVSRVAHNDASQYRIFLRSLNSREITPPSPWDEMDCFV